MATKKQPLRIAMPAWEIGRVDTGLGAKIGGLGVIIEELPAALIKAPAAQNTALEIEILAPCFAYYDRTRLTDTGIRIPVVIDGHTFDFQVFKHTFQDGQTVIYFWDEGQLHWTVPSAIYPNDPELGYLLYAAVSQAMAGYIKRQTFHTIHSHDYHVGLIPFYLGDEYLADVPHHFTIHNATYQGLVPVGGYGGYDALYRINLPGHDLFHKYFDYFDHLNFMKAVMLKTHETGGKITTVSGDIAGTWGYAAELREGYDSLRARAAWLKGAPVGDVFHPNRGLDLFEKLPIAGITNGLSERNKPENLPELKALHLQSLQHNYGTNKTIFMHEQVQSEMLTKDHSFDHEQLDVKAKLKKLLHLETFDTPIAEDTVLITAVGRLVGQKNLGLILDIMGQVLTYDSNVKFIILASAPDGDGDGKAAEAGFTAMATQHPQRVYYNSAFNPALSKLIFAGGDFTLIPSRFEPCGLVDYEASLLGNIVIGRLTGGLAKVRHCAYLYEWLDIFDRTGEANAFFQQVRAAIETYRHDPVRHRALVQTAMTLDATWDSSAAQYIKMYRYGLLMKRWYHEKARLVIDYQKSLKSDQALFAEFFLLGKDGLNDALDQDLRDLLP